MKLVIPLVCIALLAACGQPQQQAAEEAYSAPSSPDARGQPGYSENPTQSDQIQGEASGRASAATGATDQGLNDLPAGDASADSQVRQPEETP